MIRLGNKGQSLVLFVLLIPLMLVVLALVIDCGYVMVEKRELDNVTEMVVNYGVFNLNDNDVSGDMVNLFELNIDDASVEVSIDDKEISVNSNKYVKGIFSRIIGYKGFEIKSNYSVGIHEVD